MNRIKKIFLVSILCGALFSPLFFVQAQEDPAPDVGASTPKISPAIDFPKLSVKLPGLNFDKAVCTATECSNNWLAKYIQALYEYGIGIIGILAVITMMIGGIVWVTAAGNDQRIGEAKKWIGGSLMGVLIALTSYVVLNMVNPALTKLSPIKIDTVAKIDLDDFEEPPGYINLYPGTYGPDNKPSNNPHEGCPPGLTTLDQLAEYFTTKVKGKWVKASTKGRIINGYYHCDCSQFSQKIGECANLPPMRGEGTTEGLYNGSTHTRITEAFCNNPTLKPGDVIIKRGTGKDGERHMLTYIGNNKVIECGGGNAAGRLVTNGAIKISNFKEKCLEYMYPNNSYYFKR